MGKFKDLTGQKFGRLTVIERAPNKGKRTMWKCVCSCPKKTVCIVGGGNLVRGHHQGCGCVMKDKNAKMHLKHGFNKRNDRKGIYSTWATMKARCYNPKNQKYYRYGGRGITVCPEWLDKENGFINFYNYVSELPHFGEKGYTLNRIDNDGNYEPGNVEWSDDVTQANNRRTSHFISYNGETHTIAEWAKILNMNYGTLSRRINVLKWSIEKALNTPVK